MPSCCPPCETGRYSTFDARDLRGMKNTCVDKGSSYLQAFSLLYDNTQLLKYKTDSLTDGSNGISVSLVLKVIAMNRYSHLTNLVVIFL